MTGARPIRSLIIDIARIVGATAIFLYHFGWDYELTFGRVSIPGLAMTPVQLFGRLAVWGIALFIVISGLSLTMALAARRYRYSSWAVRRLERLLVPFWIVAIPYLGLAFLTGDFVASDAWKLPIWLSGLGVVSPATYLPPSQAWWYVSLALQLALLVPVLNWVLQKTGPLVTALCCSAATLGWLWWVKGLPLVWHYLDQGAAPARLIEFGLGIVVAWFATNQKSKQNTLMLLSSVGVLLLASWIAQGVGARTPLLAMVVFALVLVVAAVSGGLRFSTTQLVAVVAGATYVFYLSHPPVSRATAQIAHSLGRDNFWIVGLVAFAAASVVAAVFVVLDHFVSGLWKKGLSVTP